MKLGMRVAHPIFNTSDSNLGNTMTTATMNQSQAAFVNTASRNVANTASRNVARKQPGLSLAAMFDVVQKTLMMARSVPQTGRVSAKQVEKMRAMAAAI